MKEELSYISNTNPSFIDDLYQQFIKDPQSIDMSWQKFFEGYLFRQSESKNGTATLSDKEVAIIKLIHGYRSRGHLITKQTH